MSLALESSPAAWDTAGLGAPPPSPWPHQGLTASTAHLSIGAALYGRLKGYLLTEEQFKENGYPFLHPERPGGAVIFTTEDKPPKDCESPPPPVLHRGCRGWVWMAGMAPHPPVPCPHSTASCRVCCRCGTEYLVSPSGRCVRDEECYYHWGRLRRNRGETPAGPLPSAPPLLLNFLSLCCTL